LGLRADLACSLQESGVGKTVGNNEVEPSDEADFQISHVRCTSAKMIDAAEISHVHFTCEIDRDEFRHRYL
jgi:hypothetical protein